MSESESKLIFAGYMSPEDPIDHDLVITLLLQGLQSFMLREDLFVIDSDSPQSGIILHHNGEGYLITSEIYDTIASLVIEKDAKYLEEQSGQHLNIVRTDDDSLDWQDVPPPKPTYNNRCLPHPIRVIL